VCPTRRYRTPSRSSPTRRSPNDIPRSNGPGPRGRFGPLVAASCGDDSTDEEVWAPRGLTRAEGRGVFSRRVIVLKAFHR
jgi:hypothetical protein